MDVTIEQITGPGRFSKKLIRFNVYRIRVDGMDSGTVGTHEGAPICLSENFSPIDREEIARQVAELKSQSQVEANSPPDVPAELRQQQEPQEDVDDELDA